MSVAMRIRASAAVGLATLLASCATTRPAAPPPPPAAPGPASVAPAPTDWRDLPLAAGEWRWQPGSARFGSADAVLLGLACDAAARTILITVKGGVAPGARADLTFTVSDGTFTYPAVAGDGGIVARTPASDASLDKLAFSRGRFAIAAPVAGLQQTLLPVRPELGRVIDDCRR